MRPTLEDRMNTAENLLGNVEVELGGVGSYVSANHRARLLEFCRMKTKIPYWKHELVARDAAHRTLTALEKNVDKTDLVNYLGVRLPVSIVRHLLLQSYLSVTWSLADGVCAEVGGILLVNSKSANVGAPCQLVRDFILGWQKQAPGSIGCHICESFGWPLAVFYSLRNAFAPPCAKVG